MRVCLYCRSPLVFDRNSRAVHTSLSYACRDRWGAVLGTYAEPVAIGGVLAPPAPR